MSDPAPAQSNGFPADAPWWARWLAKELPVFWDRVTTGIITVVTMLVAADTLSPDTVASVVPASLMHWAELGSLLVTLYTKQKGTVKDLKP